VNEILAMAKDVENRIIDRRVVTNDIVEHKDIDPGFINVTNYG
jgi:hypothetical protein